MTHISTHNSNHIQFIDGATFAAVPEGDLAVAFLDLADLSAEERFKAAPTAGASLRCFPFAALSVGANLCSAHAMLLNSKGDRKSLTLALTILRRSSRVSSRERFWASFEFPKLGPLPRQVDFLELRDAQLQAVGF